MTIAINLRSKIVDWPSMKVKLRGPCGQEVFQNIQMPNVKIGKTKKYAKRVRFVETPEGIEPNFPEEPFSEVMSYLQEPSTERSRLAEQDEAEMFSALEETDRDSAIVLRATANNFAEGFRRGMAAAAKVFESAYSDSKPGEEALNLVKRYPDLPAASLVRAFDRHRIELPERWKSKFIDQKIPGSSPTWLAVYRSEEQRSNVEVYIHRLRQKAAQAVDAAELVRRISALPQTRNLKKSTTKITKRVDQYKI